MLVQKRVPKEWQTGWKGGDFTTSQEFKPHWFSTFNGLNKWSGTSGTGLGTQVGQDYCHIHGKNGLFSGAKDTQRNIGGECDFTMYDMDQTKPQSGLIQWYGPYSEDLSANERKVYNPIWQTGITDTSSVSGGLGCGNYLNRQIVMYRQKQTPVTTQKKYCQYHLQVRNTWEFAEDSEYDRTAIDTKMSIPK